MPIVVSVPHNDAGTSWSVGNWFHKLAAAVAAAAGLKRRYKMHWIAVLIAAYALAFLEFWQLCENAPPAPEDT
jgi:hypothetical protein